MAMGTDLEFTLHSGTLEVPVRLQRAGGRWVATVQRPDGRVAIGPTARAALHAAVEAFEAATQRELLADLALLPPSVDVLRLEAVQV